MFDHKKNILHRNVADEERDNGHKKRLNHMIQPCNIHRRDKVILSVSPHAIGDIYDKLQLIPLLLFRQAVALFR
ncbi:hypothetical protein PEC301937_20060 [Pectobacterium carotovorum subsp. carotovorum]|nr:hypothetical protein PEC301937_20060 [Pectobacterium carotovorum subsp. carotovorum]